MQWWYDIQFWPQEWCRFGWVGHFPVHVGSQRTLPNSPLGHSLYCPKLVTLYYVTFYEMKQDAMKSACSSCTVPHNMKSVLNPWREKSPLCFFEEYFSTSCFLLLLSNHWPSLNSISLSATEDIWQQQVFDAPYQCNSVSEKK